MVASPEFFIRVLAELADPQVALVLTPQKFYNYDLDTDIFNHSNLIYWQISLPGLDGWDNVSCTGTNFVVRAKAAAQARWFPTYTLGEDMALALEIQQAGWKGAYVKEYLAMGEVPTSVRSTFMQKSRWCKGGMQIFFSHHNAMLAPNLTFMQKLIWNTSGWAYICTTVTTPVFQIIPIVGVWLGYFPLEFGRMFALAFCIYFPATHMLLYYCHDVSHMRSIFFSVTAGNMFWFAYAKATFNTLFSAAMHRQIKFKTTEKSIMAADVTDAANKAVKKSKTARSPLAVAWMNVQDVWIHIVTFVLCAATAACGGYRLHNEYNNNVAQTLSILVSMGWALYNMTAPFLLIYFCLFGSRGLRVITTFAAVLSSCIVGAIVILIWIVLPNEYDYSNVLRMSLRFYAAQRSGALPADNPIPWRGDSALGDRAPNGASLVGGYYDDGGTVKYGFPLASAAALLAWGLLEFPGGYQGANLAQAQGALRWATDYMLACQLDDANGSFVAQVGSFEADRAFWGRPELMSMARPVARVNSAGSPGTDLLASTAAALAAAGMALADDPAYATRLIVTAQQLYGAAVRKPQGRYSDVALDAASLYPSSGYLDDLAWGAAWLAAATGQAAYLRDAAAWAAAAASTPSQAPAQPQVFNWDNQLPGVYVLLSNLTGYRNATFTTPAEKFLGGWLDASNGVARSPAFASWLGPTGALRNQANAALLAWVYAKGSGGGPGKLFCWAEFQIRYLLGDSGESFMVGFGPKSPLRPTHGAASCPGDSTVPCDMGAFYATGPNPHELEGALVSGPAFPNDAYQDLRSLVNSRVALDYNAGFTGMLAALVEQGHATYTHCTQGHGFFYNLWFHSPI
ncbi:hypothetical protein WJX81_001552 [Elliptochloris bilobata]|uniref:cellulase n=1 Tax=Elliptochloris bilobata TaxID=381761 RepID=A0AAW1SG45_9CHLO